MASGGLTVPERIILAALGLEESGRSPFTAEDLVVAAWERYKQTFGLQGYSDRFPDSNRVLTNIMGTKGLRGKGWIVKVGEKRYRLTEAGRQTARGLTHGSVAAEEVRAGDLTREAILVLERMMSSPPVRKDTETGDVEDVTFSDACAFWGISARSTANILSFRFAEIEQALGAASAAVSRNARVIGSAQAPITLDPGVVERLRALDTRLRARFDREIKLIEKRTDERRL